MQHLKITDNLYLITQSINKTAPFTTIQPPANRILIFDESGSMHGVYRSDEIPYDAKGTAKYFRGEDLESWWKKQG